MMYGTSPPTFVTLVQMGDQCKRESDGPGDYLEMPWSWRHPPCPYGALPCPLTRESKVRVRCHRVDAGVYARPETNVAVYSYASLFSVIERI